MSQYYDCKVSETEVNFIESLDYEQSARRDLIAFMLENNMNTNTEAFQRYSKERSEFYAQFEMAKSELEQKYMPEDWRGHEVKWDLHYQSGTIQFEKLCTC